MFFIAWAINCKLWIETAISSRNEENNQESISSTFMQASFILAPKNFKPKTQLCNFWRQNISAKWVPKMLMKLSLYWIYFWDKLGRKYVGPRVWDPCIAVTREPKFDLNFVDDDFPIFPWLKGSLIFLDERSEKEFSFPVLSPENRKWFKFLTTDDWSPLRSNFINILYNFRK